MQHQHQKNQMQMLSLASWAGGGNVINIRTFPSSPAFKNNTLMVSLHGNEPRLEPLLLPAWTHCHLLISPGKGSLLVDAAWPSGMKRTKISSLREVFFFLFKKKIRSGHAGWLNSNFFHANKRQAAFCKIKQRRDAADVYALKHTKVAQTGSDSICCHYVCISSVWNGTAIKWDRKCHRQELFRYKQTCFSLHCQIDFPVAQ